ncbi:hypothetical protein P5G51_002535 [Virgibacillus sp. 179-BFC.A HS]|uniref:Uncharacterized protein n=1 Tax=Tigheibacillus jepli TaxID=3035914 RepID=A0ABU5CDQ2_9BACI|nr:hypothetical protein [Virgibacillus sp. 179-BFC.A HS]MDY0404439.1 hypothetical protein [Virgibacillus sp. 179-BFC.A HS]
MKILQGIGKFFVANLVVVLAIMLLPVFLVTDDVSIMDQLMTYLFSNKS